MKIRQADGTLREERLEIRRSVHGPVVFDQNGVTIAMRVAGLDRPKMLEQWFRMGEARTLEEFQSALRMMSVPMWHANYADDKQHIMFVFDGLVPRRRAHDYQYWSRVVPGDTSETLWTDYLSFDELPKSIDPASGWHQNANEPPWLVTQPQLDRSKYPPYVAPDGQTLPTMRTLRSLRMITEGPRITYEQLIAKKHSTRMELADRILPDLLKAAGETEPGRVLANWDRQTDVESRGAVLFQMFVDRYFSAANGGMADKLRVRYDPARPLESAHGLADPASAVAALTAAADECRAQYGAIDVKWGDVFRFASGDADLPGNGGPGGSGLFRTIAFTRREGNKYYAASGETIVCAIEFARRQRSQCLLGYGNATQPGSPHLEDQLPLMVQKKLLPVYREKKDIEANLEMREALLRRPYEGRPCSRSLCRTHAVGARTGECESVARVLRKPLIDSVADCDCDFRASGRPGRVYCARRGPPDGCASSLLSRRIDGEPNCRFRYQGRSLAASLRVERKVSRRGKWWMGRDHRVCGDGYRADARLCDREHRHRTFDAWRFVCGWASGES